MFVLFLKKNWYWYHLVCSKVNTLGTLVSTSVVQFLISERICGLNFLFNFLLRNL